MWTYSYSLYCRLHCKPSYACLCVYYTMVIDCVDAISIEWFYVFIYEVFVSQSGTLILLPSFSTTCYYIYVHWCNNQFVSPCVCVYLCARVWVCVYVLCVFVCACLCKQRKGAAWRRAVVMEPESPAAQLFSQCIVNFTTEPTTLCSASPNPHSPLISRAPCMSLSLSLFIVISLVLLFALPLLQWIYHLI